MNRIYEILTDLVLSTERGTSHKSGDFSYRDLQPATPDDLSDRCRFIDPPDDVGVYFGRARGLWAKNLSDDTRVSAEWADHLLHSTVPPKVASSPPASHSSVLGGLGNEVDRLDFRLAGPRMSVPAQNHPAIFAISVITRKSSITSLFKPYWPSADSVTRIAFRVLCTVAVDDFRPSRPTVDRPS